MYQTRPDDYDAFRCIAGACPQTCCAAWEIVVDPDAQDAYLRLQHPLAEKLRRVMRVDADGDTYFAQTDGRCPFLCADGLCELQRTLGAQSLCRTCRDFPRWEVLLCDRVEQGLSLACPEAARQLLARTAPLRFESVRIPDDGYVPGARERRLTEALMARPDARAADAPGAYGAGEPRGGGGVCLCGAAPARQAPARGAGCRKRAAAVHGCVCRVPEARSAGGGVCIARAARSAVAGAAPARGCAAGLPAAPADADAADVPCAGDRLAARYGRARRPRRGFPRAVCRGGAAAARLPCGCERVDGRTACRVRHARDGK